MRVLIADDHELVRRGICTLLTGDPNFTVCGEAVDGREAVDKAAELKPDLVIMDISMPKMNGLEATRRIKALVPEINVVMVSQHESAEMVRQALEAGAGGYVAKSTLATELLGAIAKMSGGDPLVSVRVRTEAEHDAEEMSQRSTQEAERASALLAAIMDSSDDAIISKSLDGTINSWNRSAERLFGYRAEEAIGKNISLIIPSDRLGEEAMILERLKRGERIDHFETVRATKDGRLLDISMTISPVRDADGRIIGASKVARDFREQRRAAGRLQASEEHFRTIFETSPECVKVVNRDGTLLHMNSSGLAMVGAGAAEQVVGKDVYQLIAPEHREAFREFNERICGGEKGELEFDIVGLDGTRRNMETHAAPLRRPDGTVVQLGVTRDVTERKRIERVLREEEGRLAALAAKLDSEVRLRTSELEFQNTEVVRQADVLRELSNRLLQSQDNERRRVARELHDGVGQVLSAIGMNFAQLANEKEKLSDRGRQCLSEIHEMIEQASQEIRTVSHLLHPPLLDELGLDSAVRWYVEGFSERSKIAVRTNLPPKFGRNLSRDVTLSLFRVVQECLTNIHRHSGSATAEVTVHRSSGMITLEVSDEGKGIPADTQSKISAGESGGVGFRGMRERVRQFGGHLEIRSNEEGTRIKVTLPVTESTEAQGESAEV